MMNVVHLQGRFTQEPEIRYTKDNAPVATFTLAVKRDFVSKSGDDVEFIKVTAFDKTAALVRDHCKKGQMILMTGRLNLNSYTDKDGQRRSNLQVYADKIYFVDAQKQQSGTHPAYNGGFVDVSAADDDSFELPF